MDLNLDSLKSISMSAHSPAEKISPEKNSPCSNEENSSDELSSFDFFQRMDLKLALDKIIEKLELENQKHPNKELAKEIGELEKIASRENSENKTLNLLQSSQEI